MIYVFDETAAKRTINGTDWPVNVTVRKDGRKWITEKTCNGACEASSSWNTKSEAIGAANVMVAKEKASEEASHGR